MLSHFDHKRKRECSEIEPCYYNDMDEFVDLEAIKIALFEAIKDDNFQAVHELISGKQITIDYQRDEAGNTALHLAAEKGHSGIVNILIKNGASLDARNYEGNTPLHFAAYFGQADIVERLVQLGANVFLKNNSGSLPIDCVQGKDSNRIASIIFNHQAISCAFIESKRIADLRVKRFATEISTDGEAPPYKQRNCNKLQLKF